MRRGIKEERGKGEIRERGIHKNFLLFLKKIHFLE